MKYNYSTTTVNGQEFTTWDDYMMRGTYAENENGEVRLIKSSGYLSNDLTIRKAIALCFNLPTFRK